MIRSIRSVEHNKSRWVERPRWSKLTTHGGHVVWHDNNSSKPCPTVGSIVHCVTLSNGVTYTKKG